jgi:hypothetical protein
MFTGVTKETERTYVTLLYYETMLIILANSSLLLLEERFQPSTAKFDDFFIDSDNNL